MATSLQCFIACFRLFTRRAGFMGEPNNYIPSHLFLSTLQSSLHLASICTLPRHHVPVYCSEV